MLLGYKSGMSIDLLPYDAEVEYLESTGTQYIDMGVKKTTTTTIDCLFSLTDTAVSAVFGGRKSQTEPDRYALFCLGTYFRFDAGGLQLRLDIAPNKTSIFRFQYDGSNATITDTTTGSVVSGAVGIGTDGVMDIALFACNTNGTIGNYLKGRIYSYKIHQNGIIVRDFVPVRLGDVGYMYDRVSKRLFGNAGTGDFVLGPDVVPVEYIESTGAQYIDTGIKYKSTYSVRLNYTRIGMGVSGSIVAATKTTAPVFYFPALNSSSQTDRFVLRRTGYTEQRLDYDFSSYPYTAEVYLDAQNDVLYINGEAKKTGMIAGMGGYDSPYESASDIYLFSMAGSYYGLSRIYGFSIEENGAKKLDLIPVRVGDVGYMFDRVSGALFGNAGTGAFAVGPDSVGGI